MTRKNIKVKNKKHKFKDILLSHIENNLKEYILASLIFIIGILLGIVLFNNLNSIQLDEINNYLTTSLENLKNNNNLNLLIMLKEGIKSNIFLVVILWLMGSTIIGLLVVYFIVCFKGFSFGYTVSAVIYVLGSGKGIIFLLLTMLLKNIVVIPCIMGLTVSGMRLYKSIMQNRRKENVKLEILRHTLFSIFILLVLIVFTVLDTYFTVFSLKYYINFI